MAVTDVWGARACVCNASRCCSEITRTCARRMYKRARYDPPLRMFKGLDGDFDRHPTSVAELVRMENHNLRLYPNAVRWHEHKADQPGWRSKTTGWPDECDQWEDHIYDLVEEGVIEDEDKGLDYLYKHNQDFKEHMDSEWKNMKEADARRNIAHLMSFLHREVTTMIWMQRIAGEHWRKAA